MHTCIQSDQKSCALEIAKKSCFFTCNRASFRKVSKVVEENKDNMWIHLLKRNNFFYACVEMQVSRNMRREWRRGKKCFFCYQLHHAEHKSQPHHTTTTSRISPSSYISDHFSFENKNKMFYKQLLLLWWFVCNIIPLLIRWICY